ncbi:hypothetical protein [Rhizobium sp. L1K21]|nr:hypothetical protein [Rhizobium sp. L1K21]MCO6185759.1 hypothetical protein [Rhizobium sp. L1K21]
MVTSQKAQKNALYFGARIRYVIAGISVTRVADQHQRTSLPAETSRTLCS